MPTNRLHASPRRLRLKLRLGGAAVAAIALVSVWQAAAQDRDLLRGEVPEDAINDELLRRRQNAEWQRAEPSATDEAAQTTGTTQVYQPASLGAEATDPASDDGGLFSSGTLAETDAGASTPRASSTARRLAEAARARNSPPDGTAADATGVAVEEETGGPSNARAEAAARLGADAAGRVQRAEAIEGIDRTVEEDPYAPVGLRLGTFNLFTTAEQGLTWTSNVNSSVDAEAALISESTLRLRAESDWAEHAASLQAYGTLRESIDRPEVDDNEAGFDATLRLDLADTLRANATLGYLRRPESASSPVVIEDAVSRPLRETLTATAGLEKDIGKLRLAAVGGLVYDAFGDADLASGGVLSQEERNSLLGTLRLRAGYEISPAVTPFVEAEIGRREYEIAVDSAGYARSADRLAARGGVALDLGEKLRGELAVGWLRETPDDARLEEISGATLDANLVWSPQRGTNVTLYGGTTVEGTTTPGESGSLLHIARLNVERQIRANLTGNALVGAEYRDYAGSDGYDLTLTAEAGLTWWLNRYLGVTGRARHEQVESNLEGRDTKTDSVFLGVRLQR